MFLRTVLSQSRAVAAAKSTRSFHSPFVVLGASNTTLEQPSPTTYEKQYESNFEPDTPSVHVVSPRSEGTYYHVPTGAYSNSTPFASAEDSWAQRKDGNNRK